MIGNHTPILVFALLAPVPALADGFELGLALGGHAFSDASELGAHDLGGVEMSEAPPDSSGLVGARVAKRFGNRLALEGEAMMIPTADALGTAANVYGLRAHGRVDLLTGRVRPFVVLGAGAHVVRGSSAAIHDDVDRAYHWGSGVRVAIAASVEARLDLRQLIVPDRTLDGATSDYEVTAGMTYRFGARKRPAPRPVVVEIPVVEHVAEPSPPPPPPPAPPPEPFIEELAGIGFQHDSAVIDVHSAYLLERAFAMLVGQPALSIEISGHTSSEGDASRNIELSLRRAEAVKQYLVRRGIDPDRIMTIGHGADKPIADNKTPEGKRANRRIEFRVVETSGFD